MIVQAQAPKTKNATSNFIPTGKRRGMQVFYRQARLVYSTACQLSALSRSLRGRPYATMENPTSPCDCRLRYGTDNGFTSGQIASVLC